VTTERAVTLYFFYHVRNGAAIWRAEWQKIR